MKKKVVSLSERAELKKEEREVTEIKEFLNKFTGFELVQAVAKGRALVGKETPSITEEERAAVLVWGLVTELLKGEVHE